MSRLPARLFAGTPAELSVGTVQSNTQTARRRDDLDQPAMVEHEEEKKQQEEEGEGGGDYAQTDLFFGVPAVRLPDGTYALEEKGIFHVCKNFPKEGGLTLLQTRQLRARWPKDEPFYVNNSTRWVLQEAAFHALMMWCEPKRFALTVLATMNPSSSNVVSPFGSSSMTPAPQTTSFGAALTDLSAEVISAISAQLARLTVPGETFDRSSPQVRKQ